ncbi:hypothetical protein [Lysinibacillus telephonicus]|uniref:hypothetical protein n=1 Tax=Lysinibacillus telephonicus TaxID=1714840 RepID=UPI000F840A93|nr:hypothetical protein [Lysinibacillus telephonicus]
MLMILTFKYLQNYIKIENVIVVNTLKYRPKNVKKPRKNNKKPRKKYVKPRKNNKARKKGSKSA